MGVLINNNRIIALEQTSGEATEWLKLFFFWSNLTKISFTDMQLWFSEGKCP